MIDWNYIEPKKHPGVAGSCKNANPVLCKNANLYMAFFLFEQPHPIIANIWSFCLNADSYYRLGIILAYILLMDK